MQEGNWDLNMPLHVVRSTRTYPLTPYDLAAHLYKNDPIRRLTKDIFGVAAPKSASGPNGRDRFIQDALAKLGFLNGKPDGVYGPGTATAVKAFRKKFNLPPGDAVDGPCYDKMCEVLEEMGRTGQVGARPGDGLKTLPPEEKKLTGAAGSAGAAVAGAGATAGAVVLGAGEDGDITTANTATTTTPAAPPPTPVTEPTTALVPVDATAPATVDATAPPTTTTTATATVPPTTDAPATTGGLGTATEDVLFKVGMHDVTKGQVVTVGACGLFVTAVLLFAIARRTAESTGK
jgi:peptidoglycan hydrolase-like protein with peptidoglycan-binding domain